MQELPTDEGRRIVPRLRTFAQSVVAGELGSLREPKESLGREEFEAKVVEWKAQPALGLAVDLMSSALVLGIPNEAEPIAWWTLNQRDSLAPTIILLAESCTSPDRSEGDWKREANSSAQSLLRRARASIKNVGADAMVLVDMSYAYLILGKREAAERAIKTALHLAPNSRLAGC